MKRKMCSILGLGAALCLLSHVGIVYGGYWEYDEDKKKWQYLEGRDEPAREEWIEADGKEYYVDSKGYLKTGWVTDAYDGSKYYTGEDGAKRFNMFTPDGKYVGPEGTILEKFDKYRKETKKQLTKILSDKAFKGLAETELPGFLLMDLNSDGYRDIVAANHAGHPDRVVQVAVWDPEEEGMVLLAEADAVGEETSKVTYHAESQTAWLVMAQGAERDYFQIDPGGDTFQNVWHFTVDTDDWGDPLYRVNGAATTEEEWFAAIAEADAEAGTEAGQGAEGPYIQLDADRVAAAVDRAPAQEELGLWE